MAYGIFVKQKNGRKKLYASFQSKSDANLRATALKKRMISIRKTK